MKPIDIIGKKYGRLTVVKFDGFRNGRPYFLCSCDCGKTKVIQKYNLMEGKTKSCGCYHVEQTLKAVKISDNRARQVDILEGMKYRCYKKSTPNYKNYGARGIKICDEWLNSIDAFCDWADKNGYAPDLSIERIDVNGDYCPENCTWVSRKDQCLNKTDTVRITFNNKTQTLSQWSDELGLPRQTLHNRIRVHHWDIERALTTPRKNSK